MDIELKAVTKQFGTKTVLKDLNMIFSEGRINCLMGASGSGKTTIVNLLTELILPDRGEITGLKDKSCSVVFQEDRLIEHWNAVKNIRLVCGRDITAEQVLEELSRLSITEDREKPVRAYSGGMRRRVAIIRAMLAKGNLVILDEPFRGLDTDLKKSTITYIKEMTAEKTVIVVTHDIEDVKLLEAKLLTLVPPCVK